MVKGRATPDDPDLAGYWRYRRDKHGTPLDGTTANLLARQHGYCPICRDRLIDPVGGVSLSTDGQAEGPGPHPDKVMQRADRWCWLNQVVLAPPVSRKLRMKRPWRQARRLTKPREVSSEAVAEGGGHGDP